MTDRRLRTSDEWADIDRKMADLLDQGQTVTSACKLLGLTPATWCYHRDAAKIKAKRNQRLQASSQAEHVANHRAIAPSWPTFVPEASLSNGHITVSLASGISVKCHLDQLPSVLSSLKEASK